MKIIAKTDRGFILEASENEVVRLAGYYSVYTQGTPTFKCGNIIQVDAMYDQLYKLVDNASKCKSIADMLREMADTLVATKPILEEIT